MSDSIETSEREAREVAPGVFDVPGLEPNSSQQSRVEANGEGASASSPAPSEGQFIITRGSRYLAEVYLDLEHFQATLVERPGRAYRFRTSDEAEYLAAFLSCRLGSDFSSHYLPDLFPDGVPQTLERKVIWPAPVARAAA